MRDRAADEGFQVMEVPQSPRLTPGDRRLDTPVSDPRAVPRPGWRRHRQLGQLGARRLGTWAIVVVCGIVATIYAGSLALDSAVRWLHSQSEYQLEFSEIELVPAPPAWFRGGTQRFLERVRQDANESEHIPVLDDAYTGRVALAFKSFAWVKRVARVEYPARKMRVELEYYEPVATVQLSAVDFVGLDEAGHVLPIEDVDEKQRPLIRIVARGVVVENGLRPGLLWKSADVNVDRKILHAARLAKFLMDPERRAFMAEYPPSFIDRIETESPDGPNPNDGPGWLWIAYRGKKPIPWGNAPGEEAAGEKTAEAKWNQYRDAWKKIEQKASGAAHKSE